jgi:purine-binding chemotaxis protein CheW
VGFLLDGQNYALRIDRVREIVNPSAVTKLPEVPAYVEGVTNLRGTIIPIVNLRRLFGLPPRDVDADTRTIVVDLGTKTVGCTVDVVTQVMRISADQIQAAPEMPGASAAYVEALARMNDEVVIILHADRMFDPVLLTEVVQGNATISDTDEKGDT